MKTYFIKIDQYLLENYPTIWNTKIIWVLLVNIVIHILFFLMGFLSYINPESLQRSNVISDFFYRRSYFYKPYHQFINHCYMVDNDVQEQFF